jgi:nucleoid-associated protein Lsr2
MATQVITVLTDDLDGTNADRTVEFGLDGVTYTIDLSDKNAGKLRKALEPYIAAGHRVGRGPSGGRRAPQSWTATGADRSSRDQNQAVRAWAAKNGHQVSDRGRIPASVVEAFNKAH